VVLIEDERDVATPPRVHPAWRGYDFVSAERAVVGSKCSSRTHDVRGARSAMPARHVWLRRLQGIRADAKTADTGVLMLTAKASRGSILGLEVVGRTTTWSGRSSCARSCLLVTRVLCSTSASPIGARRCPFLRLPRGVIKVGGRSSSIHHARRRSFNHSPTQLLPLVYSCSSISRSRSGRVFSREELLEQVWEMRGDINTRAPSDVHVSVASLSLGTAPADVIETVQRLRLSAKRDRA